MRPTTPRGDGNRWSTETETRVGYDGFYFLIVPDHAAGRRHRFTVYRIPGSPSRRVKIVGRELTLGIARKIAMGIIPTKG